MNASKEIMTISPSNALNYYRILQYYTYILTYSYPHSVRLQFDAVIMYMIILHIHNIGNINLTEEFSVSLSHSYLVKSHVARRPSPVASAMHVGRHGVCAPSSSLSTLQCDAVRGSCRLVVQIV